MSSAACPGTWLAHTLSGAAALTASPDLQMEDEDSILPRKLQVALEHILEQRNDLTCDQDGGPLDCVHGKCQGPEQLASG